MSWRVAKAALACWFCPHLIAAGLMARFGDASPAVYCATCALARLGESAPPLETQDPGPEPAPITDEPQPSLFDTTPHGAKFRSIDAREALEELRAKLGDGGGQ